MASRALTIRLEYKLFTDEKAAHQFQLSFEILSVKQAIVKNKPFVYKNMLNQFDMLHCYLCQWCSNYCSVTSIAKAVLLCSIESL